MKYKKIGVGGSIASGKSAFCQIIRDQGYPVIDADVIARQVIEPGTEGYHRVKQHFPKAFTDQGLDRKKLGQMIFTDVKKRELLNSLLHPLIISESRRQMNLHDGIVFYEAALLFESDLMTDFDLTIYVTANRSVQIERLMKRDGIDRLYAEKKLAAFKEPIGKPAIIVKNNGSLADFEKTTLSVLRQIISA